MEQPNPSEYTAFNYALGLIRSHKKSDQTEGLKLFTGKA